jgi:hypothetical protein
MLSNKHEQDLFLTISILFFRMGCDLKNLGTIKYHPVPIKNTSCVKMNGIIRAEQ